MRVLFDESAWDEYARWQRRDPGAVRRINALIRDIQRDPYQGLGKPEALRHMLSGCWSRRIDREHRIVYRVEGDALLIVQLRFH